MNQINCLVIEGNIAEKVSVSEVNGLKTATMPIAVSRFYKDADGKRCEEVSYFDVDCYGLMADIAEKYAAKGRAVSVVGRMAQKRYKVDGKDASKVYIIAEKIEFKPMKKGVEK